MFFINVTGEGKIARQEGGVRARDFPRDQFNRSQVDMTRAAAPLEGTRETLNVALPMKRLVTAISLYVPNELSTGWNAEYSEEDMTNLDLAAKGLDVLTGANNVNNAGMIERAIQLGGSFVAKKAFEGSEFRQMALRTTPGQSKMEQLFRRVNFRDFSFFYMFAPKSEHIKEGRGYRETLS